MEREFERNRVNKEWVPYEQLLEQRFTPVEFSISRAEESEEYLRVKVEELFSHIISMDKFLFRNMRNYGFLANELKAKDRQFWVNWGRDECKDQISITREIEHEVNELINMAYENGELLYSVDQTEPIKASINGKLTFIHMLKDDCRDSPITGAGKEFAVRYKTQCEDYKTLMAIINLLSE